MQDLFNTEFLWCGTEAARDAFIAENKFFLASNPTALKAEYGREDDEEVPRLFSMQGSVGVITIAGSLVNSDSWVNQYLGRTGYPEIRAALLHAASDPSVKAIALDIKSGGGMVSGLSDTADLVSMIDKKVKPIHTYSDSNMASAAYWLGSSARSVSIGKTAEVGSIGVLVVHQENSKMLADEGITTTVFRSGKYKALGLSAEKLSKVAEEVIQEQVDKSSRMFTEHVAQARGTTEQVVEQKMGQGRVFMGADAVDVGLVDNVTNFDSFMSKIQKGIDSHAEQPKYGANFSQGGIQVTKKALTEQEVALLAAGGATAQLAAVPPGSATTATTAASTEVTSAHAEVVPGNTQAATDDLSAAKANEEITSLKAQVTVLTAQAAAAQGQLVDLQVQLKTAEAASAPLVASIEKMRPVVQKSVANLRVAMGMSAAGVDALNDEALLAEQAGLSAQFTDKFKVGGVAGVAPGESADKGAKVADLTGLRMARIAATRNTAK